MYNDNRRSAFYESGRDKDKCFPYSILSKKQQQQQQQHTPQQPLPVHSFGTYPPPVQPVSSTTAINGHLPTAPGGAAFNTMVTDVGICFSMSNVNLNGDYPPYLGHPSLSVLGMGYNDASPPTAPKYRSAPSVLKPRNLAPATGLPPSAPYPHPYDPYYFAHPKIPVKIYNNRSYPYLPMAASSASSASVAAAYGQQLNSYYACPPPPQSDPSTLQLNAQKTMLNNQYYDICMTKCTIAMKAMLEPGMASPTESDSPPVNVDMDEMASDEELVSPGQDEDQPQDYSMKSRMVGCDEVAVGSNCSGRSSSSSRSPPLDDFGGEVMAPEECSRRAAAPKKKWIRHYLQDEPLINGHSTAPPLVVISTNGSSSSISSSSNNISHQKHHPASSLTIDLSTKSSSGHHHLSSTPPSSACSSSSSTLTISPVDDSQSSLNLSSGSSGYITSHSANSSSSLNLSGSNSGSSPLPITINGSVIAPSLGSNSSPLPHDLVIVQQQQQQQQISHLVQAGQSHGLTSTATLLSHIPTGGRRRTTSSNSNGVGTREVHNKLEKNRRAHLKECFEQLKKQLTLQPDEKKTSNLSILHAAIRHIQLLKRKEREYEHEMERLAKEKIAAQNRIVLLKREMSQWGDVDFSRLAPDTDAIPNSGANGVQSDRDLLNDPPGIAPGRNGIRYSSSSSLSSVATTASIGNLPLQTTISPVLIAASSPSRASPPSSANRNSSSPASGMSLPLSLTTKGSLGVSDSHNGTPSPLKFTTTANLPNGLNLSTSISSINGISNGSSSGGSNCSTPNSTIGNGMNGTPLPLIVGTNNLTSLSQSMFTPVTATILTTGNGTSIQTLPLNLNVASTVSNGTNMHHSSIVTSGSNGVSSSASGLQIIGTTANGTTIPAGLVSSTTGKELINGTTMHRNGFRSDSNKIEIIATQSTGGGGLDPPATKVIKLVNGNTIVGLSSVDKDKLMLSQVVQQGGLVVSPIQLLASTQGLRVIQQAPNGLATIELSTPSNVQPQSSQAQRITGGSNTSINSTSSFNSSHLSSQPSFQFSQASTHHHHPHHHHLPQQQIQQVTGAQLHKLLISSSTPNGTTFNGITSSSTSISSSTVSSSGYTNGSSPTVVSTTTITPELARLPGGAELNILPAGTNGATALPLYRTTGQPGKLAFVNAISAGHGTGLTLKGNDSGNGRTAVHVVTPIQTSSGHLSGLTPVVVSRYDQDVNLPGLFTTTAGSQGNQLGKVVKTVGQSPGGLPLIAATPNAHYLNTVLKPTATMMVAVSSTPGTYNHSNSHNSLPLDNSGSLVLVNSNQTPAAPAATSTTAGGSGAAIAF